MENEVIHSLHNLKNFNLVPIQYYMKNFDDSFLMWMHRHQYIEIMYNSSGSFTFAAPVDDNPEVEEEFKINQGQFVIVDRNMYHKLVMKKHEKAFIFNIEFSPEPIEKDNNSIRIDYEKVFNDTKLNALFNKRGFLILNDSKFVGSSLKKLILCLEEKNDSIEYKFNLAANQLQFFNEIIKCVNSKKIGSYSFIRKANEYIMDNYQSKITIDDIANYVDISKSYLEHQYKKQMGQTIYSFINVLRVQKAGKYLQSTSYPISEIAKKVGFKDKNQLNYEFKRINGKTPSQYRNSVGDKASIDFHNNSYESTSIEEQIKSKQ